ncbi:MAG: glycosyltransferase involved in cell wall biosynthesis [Alphaproteobacteria bacterium]|jgi:glycosyltransferase involved in cell wall biosynthesis
MGFTYSEWEDISVIVPAYNAEETILRALHSIAMQTVKACEIIVVDDGSTDGTFDVIQKEANLEGWIVPIRIIQQKNAGPGAARNNAIKQAKGEYLAFLDADDEWHPTKLARSIEEMKKHNCAIIAHDVIHRYPSGRKFYIESSGEFEREKKGRHTRLFLKDYINTSTVIVHKKVIKAVGGFDEVCFNDIGYDLWQSILANPENTFHVFKGALMTYHIRKKSLSSHIIKRLQDNERYIVRHVKTATKGTWTPYFILVIVKTFSLNRRILSRAFKSYMFGKYFVTLIRFPYSLLKTFMLSLIMFKFKRPNNFKGQD